MHRYGKKRDVAGEIKSYRHSEPAPIFDLKNIKSKSHIVQFYDNDGYIVKMLKDYMNTGDSVLVIATNSHLQTFKKKIDRTRKNTLVLWAAEDILSQIMVRQKPSIQKLESIFRSELKKLLKTDAHVKVLSEMVAVLWKQDNKEAAFKLEKLWHKLQKKYNFSICCVYSTATFGGPAAVNDFFEISSVHSDVIPSENYTQLKTPKERLKEISILQQKARILQDVMNERVDYELSLHNLVQKLRVSEEFNRNIVESSGDVVKVIDLNGNVLSVNENGTRLLEIDDKSEVVGKRYIDLWEGEYFVTSALALDEAKKGNVGRFQGQRLTFKGNLKWWDVVITAVRGEEGKIEMLVSVSRDITEQKEMEIRKDDFLSATSHELKTPLTIQKGYTQLLSAAIKNGDVQKSEKLAGKIEEQTNKLTNLVTNLLDVAKIQGGRLVYEPEMVDMKQLITDVVDEIQQMTETHTILVQGNLNQTVFADKERLKQVVTNLLTNGIKYSPNSDKIIIEMEDKGKEIVVCVRDMGIGIAKKDQGKVFDRFYRGSGMDEKTYPGLGLGLFISSQVIKGHSGKIWVESSKGSGSSFYFSLPLQGSHPMMHGMVRQNFSIIST